MITYERGETVEVFYRFCADKGQGYFPVESVTQGQLHPCVVKTDGWFPAVIEQRWSSDNQEKVRIKYVCPLWFNRQGQIWSESKYRRDTVTPNLVRKIPKAGERPHPKPKVSFLLSKA